MISSFCFQGDLYAVPNKKAHMGKKRVKGGRSHQNSDIEDFMSETMSHQSYNAGNHGHHFRGYVAMWLFQPQVILSVCLSGSSISWGREVVNRTSPPEMGSPL